MQPFFLFTWYLKCLLRRLTLDFYKEITILASCAVLMALFGYIFYDFITAKALEIPSSMVRTFQLVALVVLASFTTKAIVSSLKSANFRQFGLLLLTVGEKPRHVAGARLLKNCFVSTVLVAGYVFLSRQWLSQLEDRAAGLLVVSQLLLGGLLYLAPAPKIVLRRRPFVVVRSGRIWTMVQWRALQLVVRNPTTRFNLLASALLAVAAWTLYQRGTAFVLAFLLAFVSGFYAASQLFVQLKEDLNGGWAEKLMGVSHKDYLQSYFGLSLILAGVFALIALPFAIGGWNEPSEAAKMIAAQLSPLFLTPGLLFQIDARRPFIQAAVLFLIGLFLATAILAHFLSVVLVPIVGYYTLNYERDLYYRA
jgi:hypothetical protein